MCNPGGQPGGGSGGSCPRGAGLCPDAAQSADSFLGAMTARSHDQGGWGGPVTALPVGRPDSAERAPGWADQAAVGGQEGVRTPASTCKAPVQPDCAPKSLPSHLCKALSWFRKSSFPLCPILVSLGGPGGGAGAPGCLRLPLAAPPHAAWGTPPRRPAICRNQVWAPSLPFPPGPNRGLAPPTTHQGFSAPTPAATGSEIALDWAQEVSPRSVAPPHSWPYAQASATPAAHPDPQQVPWESQARAMQA